MRFYSHLARGWALFSLILALAACSNTPSATETAVDPVAMLQKAADDIQAVKTLHFKLQLTGAPAFIDTSNLISFVAADGSYVAPDQIQAKVSAAVGGVPGQIEIVAVGDQQYMKHILLTGNRWLAQQFSPGFNADTLIRGERGIKFAIESLQEVKYVGVTDLFGTPVHHITGTASVEDIQAVTVGLIRGTGLAQADVYINVETSLVEQMVLVQPETKTEQFPEPTTWTLELFDYDKPDITIDIPDAETPPPDSTPGVFTMPGQPATPSALTPQPEPTAESTAAPTVEGTSQP